MFAENRSKPFDLLPESFNTDKRDQPAQLGEFVALPAAGQLGQLHVECPARRFEKSLRRNVWGNGFCAAPEIVNERTLM